MARVVLTVVSLGFVSSMLGCAYGGLAAAGDKLVVLRNGLFSNTAYVCRVADNGVSGCVAAESP